MNAPNFYAILPATVRYDNSLMYKAKLLYAEISALSNKFGFCFAGNKYFADLYGISTRQVITIIQNLEERGYIKVERAAKKRKIRIFDADVVKKTSCESEENFTLEGEENFTHNNTSNNNINNNIYTPEFEQWYEKYPNKFNEQQTFKNWKNALKTYSVADLFRALGNYLHHIREKNVDEQYITRSTNFLGRKGEYMAWLETRVNEVPRYLGEADDEYEERLRRFAGEY